MADKQYVGSGKIVGRYNNLSIGIRVADLVANERGYCNLIVAQRREPDKYGNTHSVYIDDWTPNSRRDQRTEERQEESRQGFQPDDVLPSQSQPASSGIDDLPF